MAFLLCCHVAFLDCSVGAGVFVTGLIQISSFFSLNENISQNYSSLVRNNFPKRLSGSPLYILYFTHFVLFIALQVGKYLHRTNSKKSQKFCVSVYHAKHKKTFYLICYTLNLYIYI